MKNRKIETNIKTDDYERERKARISKSRSFPNPPSAKEISAARMVVIDVANPWEDLDADPIPECMKHHQWDGWHKDEIYFGILIGMQIAGARQDRAEAKKERKA